MLQLSVGYNTHRNMYGALPALGGAQQEREAPRWPPQEGEEATPHRQRRLQPWFYHLPTAWY